MKKAYVSRPQPNKQQQQQPVNIVNNGDIDDDDQFLDDPEDDLICSMVVEAPIPQTQPTQVRPDSKYDQLVGENCMLKERLALVKKQLQEERDAKQKIWEERESAVNELKEAYEKKLNTVQASLQFKEKDYTLLKMKNHDLEKQLKTLKAQIEAQQSSKPLPYSLPIMMHRVLDFSNNKGFVDWDDSAALDDVSG